jgi:hypothetical protein
LKKLFTQIIAANRGNRAHGYGEPMQMISDIKRCAAGKRTVREKIPECFAETKYRGIYGRCGHRQNGSTP